MDEKVEGLKEDMDDKLGQQLFKIDGMIEEHVTKICDRIEKEFSTINEELSQWKKQPTEECRDVCMDCDNSSTGSLVPDFQVEPRNGQVKLPVYDGLSSWRVYKVQSEAVAWLNNCTTEECLFDVLITGAGRRVVEMTASRQNRHRLMMLTAIWK